MYNENIKFKNNSRVRVTDDGNTWFPAIIVGIDSQNFYRYKVRMAEHGSEVVGYRFCVPEELYQKAQKMKDLLNVYRFLQTIPSGIRGTNPNCEMISKYLSIQKSMVLQGFKTQYGV